MLARSRVRVRSWGCWFIISPKPGDRTVSVFGKRDGPLLDSPWSEVGKASEIVEMITYTPE